MPRTHLGQCLTWDSILLTHTHTHTRTRTRTKKRGSHFVCLCVCVWIDGPHRRSATPFRIGCLERLFDDPVFTCVLALEIDPSPWIGLSVRRFLPLTTTAISFIDRFGASFLLADWFAASVLWERPCMRIWLGSGPSEEAFRRDCHGVGIGLADRCATPTPMRRVLRAAVTFDLCAVRRRRPPSPAAAAAGGAYRPEAADDAAAG